MRLTSFRLCSGTSLKVQRLDSALPWQGAQVRSLLRELRSHVPHNVAKKKKNTCVKGPLLRPPPLPTPEPQVRPTQLRFSAAFQPLSLLSVLSVSAASTEAPMG